jgi:hypothetical protein
MENGDRISEGLGLPTLSDIGVVFSDYGLFRGVPLLTMAFGLEMTGVPRNSVISRWKIFP